jgi:ankyrin repeat protein
MRLLFFFIFVSSISWSQDLFDACRSGNVERLKALHEINPDTLNSVNENGFSPLIISTYKNQIKVVEFLLKNNADVNFDSPEGTALIGACYKGNFEIVELLIQNKANVNVVGGNNISPLIFAVQSKNKKLVKLLVQNGADQTIKDSAGRTAKDYAMLLELKDIAELLK